MGLTFRMKPLSSLFRVVASISSVPRLLRLSASTLQKTSQLSEAAYKIQLQSIMQWQPWVRRTAVKFRRWRWITPMNITSVLTHIAVLCLAEINMQGSISRMFQKFTLKKELGLHLGIFHQMMNSSSDSIRRWTAKDCMYSMFALQILMLHFHISILWTTLYHPGLLLFRWPQQSLLIISSFTKMPLQNGTRISSLRTAWSQYWTRFFSAKHCQLLRALFLTDWWLQTKSGFIIFPRSRFVSATPSASISLHSQAAK